MTQVQTQMDYCDKCGEYVPTSNNAAMLDVLLGDFVAILAQRRHFLPTENCEGSPSRAQYIEGQPKDSRSQYGYDSYWEMQTRAAYVELLKMNDD